MVVEYYCYKETVGKKACSKMCTDCSNHLTAQKNKVNKIYAIRRRNSYSKS